MIDILGTILPLIIYLLLIILLVVVIILGIKVVIVMDRVNQITIDVENKIASFNKLFNIFNITSNAIDGIIDKYSRYFYKTNNLNRREDED